MTSSALSMRRSFLRRPKVCLTPKNPGRCHPPPPPPEPSTCKVDWEGFEVDFDEIYEVDSSCCKPSLPEGDPVDTQYDCTVGSVLDAMGPNNCEDGYFEFLGDGGGWGTITATYTFSDGSKCVSVCPVYCKPEENGD